MACSILIRLLPDPTQYWAAKFLLLAFRLPPRQAWQSEAKPKSSATCLVAVFARRVGGLAVPSMLHCRDAISSNHQRPNISGPTSTHSSRTTNNLGRQRSRDQSKNNALKTQETVFEQKFKLYNHSPRTPKQAKTPPS